MGEFLKSYWSQCMVIMGLLGFVLQQAWIWHYKKKERFYDRYRPLIDEYLDSIYDFVDDLKSYELQPQPNVSEMDKRITYPAFKLTRLGRKLSFYSDKEISMKIEDINNLTSDFLFNVSQIYQKSKVDILALNNFGFAKREYMNQLHKHLDSLSVPIKKYLKQ